MLCWLVFKDLLGPYFSENNLWQIQNLPYVLYRYRYRIRLEGKSSIGIDIEFEKKEQLANIRFRTQTNVYRTTLHPTVISLSTIPHIMPKYRLISKLEAKGSGST